MWNAERLLKNSGFGWREEEWEILFGVFLLGTMADGGHLSKTAMAVVVDGNGGCQWIFVNCNGTWLSLTRLSRR